MATGILTIDLDAIKSNWSTLNQQMSGGATCGAVVKADAYGLGAELVSTSLWDAGCRVFFVATLAEAKALRSALPYEGQIFVFSGLCQQSQSEGVSPEWEQYRLSPVLVTKEHIVRWSEYVQSHSSPPCAIKVDTGMHRLGLLPEEVDELLLSGHLQRLAPEYVMSHFACADDKNHPLNRTQMQVFDQCTQKIQQVLPDTKKSMANSSGIFLGDKAWYDLARPGAALYGVNPTPTRSSPMRPVVNLQLPVMQVKTIGKGESVGYGAKFVAQESTTIAIVFGGYADGLMRILGGSAIAFVGDQALPVIGRVSMDSLVVDVSALDNSQIENLMFIDVLNEEQTVDDLAKMAGTIGYEILTSLGMRYERRYIGQL